MFNYLVLMIAPDTGKWEVLYSVGYEWYAVSVYEKLVEKWRYTAVSFRVCHIDEFREMHNREPRYSEDRAYYMKGIFK